MKRTYVHVCCHCHFIISLLDQDDNVIHFSSGFMEEHKPIVVEQETKHNNFDFFAGNEVVYYMFMLLP